MRPLLYILCALCFSIKSLCYLPPLTQELIDQAGGNIPVFPPIPPLSDNAISIIKTGNFIANEELALYEYGLPKLEEWGLDSYPNNTIEVIKQFRANSILYLYTVRAVLESKNATAVPPCKYDFNQESFFKVNSTLDFFFAAIILQLGFEATNIAYTALTAPTDPGFSAAGASVGATIARKEAWIQTVLGQKPAPQLFDTIVPVEWPYLLYQIFVVPGSCPVKLPYPDPNPLTGTFDQRTPTGRLKQSVFTWNPCTTEPPPPGATHYILWASQIGVPSYSILNVTGPGMGITDVPEGLYGYVWTVLTYDNKSIILPELEAARKAGPFILAVTQ